MTEQRREEAIKYIMSSLEDGYLDLGLHEQDELAVIKEAMDTLRFIDECNSIGCTSFRLTPEEVKEILERQENA